MTQPLDVQMMRSRLRDYGLTAHTQVASLMFSGIFALAALALLDILKTTDHLALRLSFWIAAITYEVATLMRQMQRPILMGQSGMSDVPILVARGLLALLLFALIAPQYGGADGWRHVYTVQLLLFSCSWRLLQDFVELASRQQYDSVLQPMAEKIVERQRQFLRGFKMGLAVTAALSALVLFGPRAWSVVEPIAFGFSLYFAGIMLVAHLQNQRDWRNFERSVEEAASV